MILVLLWQKEVWRAKFIMRIVTTTTILLPFLLRLLVHRQACRSSVRGGNIVSSHARRLRLLRGIAQISGVVLRLRWPACETVKFDLNFNFFGAKRANIFNIWRLERVVCLVAPSLTHLLRLVVVLLGWNARKSLRLLLLALLLGLLLFLLEKGLDFFLSFCVYCVVHPAQKIVHFPQIFAFRTLGKFEV